MKLLEDYNLKIKSKLNWDETMIKVKGYKEQERENGRGGEICHRSFELCVLRLSVFTLYAGTFAFRLPPFAFYLTPVPSPRLSTIPG